MTAFPICILTNLPLRFSSHPHQCLQGGYWIYRDLWFRPTIHVLRIAGVYLYKAKPKKCQ